MERILTKANMFKRIKTKGNIKVTKGRSDVREYFECSKSKGINIEII